MCKIIESDGIRKRIFSYISGEKLIEIIKNEVEFLTFECTLNSVTLHLHLH